MSDDRTEEDLPEPGDPEYRQGIIMLLSVAFIAYFESSLKYQIPASLRHKAEVFVVLLLIGLVHLFCANLLSLLYNSGHLRFVPFLFAKRKQAAPRHARLAGLVFILAAIAAIFL